MSTNRRFPALAFVTLCYSVGIGFAVVTPPLTSGALFTDTDHAGSNGIDGGLLDVKLTEIGPTSTTESTTDEREADAVFETWRDTTHDTFGNDDVSNTLLLNNTASTVAVTRTNVTVSFVENDSDADDGNERDTARTIEVTEFAYDETDLTNGALTDQNANNRLDVEDLTLGSNVESLSTLSGMTAGESRNLTVAFSGSAGLLTGVGSDDGIDLTVEIRVHSDGYNDADRSKENTIQYA